MEKIIEIENLSFSFGEKNVLKNICFSVERGDIFGILGPNGAGKSTLFKILSKILKYKEGSVKLFDCEILNFNGYEYAKIAAFMPQTIQNIFPFTSKDFVMMGRFPYMNFLGIPSLEDIKFCEESMLLTDTFHLKDRFINEISGGELRRVLLARVLCQNTPVILLDEPTSNLDIHYQIMILQKIKKICNEKKITALLVLHDLNLASQFCNKILLMKNGEIIALGECENIMKYKIIKETFDIEVYIHRNEINGKLFMIPFSVNKD